MDKQKRTDFNEMTERAESVARDKERTSRLAEEAEDKADRHTSVLAPIREDLDTVVRMIRAWATGSYSRIPWKTVILLIGAVLYFLNPIDIIPDFVYGLGFIDDIAVIKFVVNSLGDDLDHFMVWEKTIRSS